MSERPLNIGIACYASFGGSGIVAAELGLALARRGHGVHFISRGVPRRSGDGGERVFFHEVRAPDYPVMAESPYTVALASTLVEVSRAQHLDLLHVHYAVPHAASAFLARSTLGAEAPRLVTTLHGTDTTIVGSDVSYQSVTRFCVAQSDGITVPSAALRDGAQRGLGLEADRGARGAAIRVIPNFVDTDRFAPSEDSSSEACLAQLFGADVSDELVLAHVSNFRAVKRIGDLVEVFARVAAEVPARLVLIGDGPERSAAEARLHELGLAERVRFLGMQERFADLLARADVFVLPSEEESFGLAALEAQACGVPVVGSETGGLAEVIADGETGLLAPVGAVDVLTGHVLGLARDPERRREMGRRARERAVSRFRREPVVDRYEAFYREVLARGSADASR